MLFEMSKLDKKLIIYIEKNVFYQTKYLFLLQKKANSILFLKIVVGKLAHINLKIILILVLSKTIK